MTKCFIIMIMVFLQNRFNLAEPKKDDSTYYQLDSIVVSSSRFEQPINQIPFSIDIIGSESLNSFHENLSSEKLFNSIPGIIVNNRYNLSSGDRIIFRGIGSRAQFGVRGIKILLDGIPLTFPDGQSQLNNLDLSTIGRLEIIHGPSSFLYGNASGGVIFIQSKGLTSSNFSLNAGYSFGSFGNKKYSLGASKKIGNNSLIFNASKILYNGFRENSAASSTMLNLISSQEFNEYLNFKAILNYNYSPYLLNPSSLNKNDAENNPEIAREFVKQQGSGKKNNQVQGGIIFSFLPNTLQKFEATIYGITRATLNPIPGRYIKLNRFSGGIRMNYSSQFSISKLIFKFLAGSDFEFQNDLRKEYENNGLTNYKNLSNDEIIKNVQPGKILLNQKEKVFGYGFFSKMEFSPINKFYASIGIRYDNYTFKVDDKLNSSGIYNSDSLPIDNVSGMIGIIYNLNQQNHIFANYSTSFQTPTTSELSNTPTGAGGFNTNLKPEQNKSYEFGYRGNLFGNLFYNASFYKLYIKKIFIPYQVSTEQSEEVFYKNAGSAVNNGIEFSLNWLRQNIFNVSAAYTFMDFKYKDFIETELIKNNFESFQLGGNEVPGIPKQKISLGFTYKFLFGLIADIFMNLSDQFFTNDFNGPEPNSSGKISDFINDSYFTTDFNISYNFIFGIAHIDLFLGVNNILNKWYNSSIVPNAALNRFYEPAPRRNWNSGISIKFI
ncbi:MAG: TonB-dependent receptor [Ignavibacteriaceae bacterium]